MIGCLFVESDIKSLVVAGVGCDLGGIQGQDVVDDHVDRLGLKVEVIYAKLVVEPLGFRLHEI